MRWNLRRVMLRGGGRSIVDKSAKEPIAFGKDDAWEWSIGSGVEGKDGLVKGEKWRLDDVKVGSINPQIDLVELGLLRDAGEKASIRGLVVGQKVVHGFVKGNMMRFLDCFGFNIVVKDVAHRLGETKKNTGAGVWNSFVGAISVGR